MTTTFAARFRLAVWLPIACTMMLGLFLLNTPLDASETTPAGMAGDPDISFISDSETRPAESESPVPDSLLPVPETEAGGTEQPEAEEPSAPALSPAEAENTLDTSLPADPEPQAGDLKAGPETVTGDIEGALVFDDQYGNDGHRPDHISLYLKPAASPVSDKTIEELEADPAAAIVSSTILYEEPDTQLDAWPLDTIYPDRFDSELDVPDLTWQKLEEVRTDIQDAHRYWFNFWDVPLADTSGKPLFYNLLQIWHGMSVPFANPENGYAAKLEREGDGLLVTDSHTLCRQSFPVDKIWEDQNNTEGLRPQSLNVRIEMAAGQTGEIPAGLKNLATELTLTAEEGWSGESEALPVYAKGSRIRWQAEEDEIPGYTSTDKSHTTTAGRFSFENKREPALVRLQVQKSFEDEENKAGLRPQSLRLKLYADTDLNALSEAAGTLPVAAEEAGKYLVQEILLNETSGWKWESEALRAYAAGKEIHYWLEEEPLKDPQDANRTYLFESKRLSPALKEAWKQSAQEQVLPVSFALTNTFIPGFASLQLHKDWVDDKNNDGKRPLTLTVKVMKDEALYTTLELNEANGWSASLENLPLYVEGKPGERIVWSVEEDVPVGYTLSLHAASAFTPADKPGTDWNWTYDFTLTNTHATEKRDLSVGKVFEDADNQDGKRPASLMVTLLKGNEELETVKLSAENNWSHTWNELSVYENQQEIEYRIAEENMTDYIFSSLESRFDEQGRFAGWTLTNTHTPETRTLSIAKEWRDKDNQDGFRPSEIQVALLANGIRTGEPVILSGPNWSWTWEKLPVYLNGEAIEYTIEEMWNSAEYSEPEISELAVDGWLTGWKLINTHVPQTRELRVLKVWNDGDNQDGLRPESVEVWLLADGNQTGPAILLSEGNGWQYTWSELPVYKAGKSIVYTVNEKNPAGYVLQETRAVLQDSWLTGWELVNTHEPATTERIIRKIWVDDENRDGLRPAEITVTLDADGVSIADYVLNAENNWSVEITGLPLNRPGSHGQAIIYTLSEPVITGYLSETRSNDQELVLVNTHEIQRRQVLVEKVFLDGENQDGLRPESVRVHLHANGNPTGHQLELRADSGWQGSFENLPAFEKGELIQYTLQEEACTGYFLLRSEIDEEGTDTTRFTLYNRHEPEKTRRLVVKRHDDENNRDGLRPDTIHVRLYGNGEYIAEADLNETNHWQFLFENLDRFACGSNGVEIDYYVEEEPVSGYETEMSQSDGFTLVLTNRHHPELTERYIFKDWQDEDNNDGLRPDSLRVYLLANGVRTGQSAVLSEANGWSASFTDLFRFEQGVPIVYTVEEENIPGYTLRQESPDPETLVLINTHEPERISIQGLKEWRLPTGSSAKIPDSITIELLEEDGTWVARTTASAAQNWEFAFTDLLKYRAGKLLRYTIQEQEMEGFTVLLEGDMKTGFRLINTAVPEEPEEELPPAPKTPREDRPESVSRTSKALEKPVSPDTSAVRNAEVPANWSLLILLLAEASRQRKLRNDGKTSVNLIIKG